MKMSEYRIRLIDGLAHVLEHDNKTLAAITIADIVAAAKVSKRTFYEHFSSKEACFLALYEQNSFRILARLVQAVQQQLSRPDNNLESNLESVIFLALNTYLDELATRSGFMARLYIDILAIEKQGIELRYRVLHAYAQQIHTLVSGFTAAKQVSISELLLFLSGVNEMALYHLHDVSLISMPELQAAMERIVRLFLANIQLGGNKA